jgi:glycerol-3-phosphate acyltransferase PlsX
MVNEAAAAGEATEPHARRRVALDAMGGDYAPGEVVLGAVQAARAFGVGVVLVGPQDTIRPELEKYASASDGLDLEVVHTDEVIAMDEHPAEAIRAKKRSSITLCHELVRDGQALGAVSAGNSGAVMAASLLTLRRIKDVDRPAFAGTFPAMNGKRTVVLDIGANTDCKPQWLAQFALMGSIYARGVAGVANPRVGLLSNGEEETKGDQLTQEAHRLLEQVASAAGLNFVGNVEGRDINASTVDVVVCDGFVGNVVLKVSEGLGKMISEVLKRELKADPLSIAGALLATPALNRLRRQLDYEEYGGVPILGVNGVSVISHGRSRAKAIKNAIRVAIQAADADLTTVIASGMRKLRAATPSEAGQST